MTSLTTILGMMPLAFGSGEGAELVRPIGQTIVGGMIMSTLMTLFLVPMLYTRLNRKHDAKRIVGPVCEDPEDLVTGGSSSQAITEGGEA